MVTVQEAFARAQEYARELLGDKEYTLEKSSRIPIREGRSGVSRSAFQNAGRLRRS